MTSKSYRFSVRFRFMETTLFFLLCLTVILIPFAVILLLNRLELKEAVEGDPSTAFERMVKSVYDLNK